jgi:hypothetical protein
MSQTNEASGSLTALPASGRIIPPTSAPHPEYSHRLTAREAEARRFNKQHIWIGNARLLAFIGIMVLCWQTGRTGVPSVYWLVGVVLVFIGLGAWDRRTVRARSRAKRAANFYRRGLARIEDQWSGSGTHGQEFNTPNHLYAEDLDILGEGSLFQLLCAARTRMGKGRLAAWLLAPATPEEVGERQLAVKELAAKLEFREDLAADGESDEIHADGEMLVRWSQETWDLNYRRWWVWTMVLAVLSLPALIYGFRAHWTPFVLLLVVNSLISFTQRNRLAQMFSSLDQACKNLEVLPWLLRRIEREQFDSPRARSLQAALLTGGVRASECVAKLARLAQLVDSRRNMFVAVLDVPLLYSIQLGFALQRWKDRYGAGVVAWIESIAEMEALCSLAAYKFEHPEDPFPEFSAAEAPGFAGVALGHPLLPASSCVRNDVILAGSAQVLLVSGSNMSGKSTLLRVAGVNAVLAMMGAPVRARKLRLSPVALGAAMRISDSLQRGVSHFYAEISRIRQVVELASKTHVLFLFDEILQGTNSHDRRVGAEGIVRALITNGAIGLVTTHDLALTTLAEVFPERVRNVHFQEKLDLGKLHFDYQLREGVVTTSNGVELMKSIGLDV